MISKLVLLFKQLICKVSSSNSLGCYSCVLQFTAVIIFVLNFGRMMSYPLPDDLGVVRMTTVTQDANVELIKKNDEQKDDNKNKIVVQKDDAVVFGFPPTIKDIMSLRERVQRDDKGSISQTTTSVKIKYGPGVTDEFGIDIDLDETHESLMERVTERVTAINDLQNQINAIKRSGYLRPSKKKTQTKENENDNKTDEGEEKNDPNPPQSSSEPVPAESQS